METKTAITDIRDLLLARRAAFDAALADVPVERMTLPGAAGLWSVKDIIAHMTFMEGWMAERMLEAQRGVVYTLTELDQMDPNERNYVEYQKFRDIPLAEVQAGWREVFQNLLTALNAQDDAALFAPRRFRGALQPVTLHDLLHERVISHYDEHLPSIARMAKAG